MIAAAIAFELLARAVDWFEERAAIVQFQHGTTRDSAEAAARRLGMSRLR